MKFSLVQQFAQSAQDAVEAFPEQFPRPVFAVAGNNTHRIIFTTEEAKRDMDERDFHHYKERMLEDKLSGMANRYMDIQYVFLDAGSARHNNGLKSHFWTMDHEIGHHAVKGAISRHIRGHRQEGRAETFAAIRHLQRGGDPSVLYYQETLSAYHLLEQRFLDYYLAESIAAVRKHAETHDVSKLTLPETAELALNIAEETKLDEKVLKNLATGKNEDDPLFQRVVKLFHDHEEAEQKLRRPKISAIFAPNR